MPSAALHIPSGACAPGKDENSKAGGEVKESTKAPFTVAAIGSICPLRSSAGVKHPLCCLHPLFCPHPLITASLSWGRYVSVGEENLC